MNVALMNRPAAHGNGHGAGHYVGRRRMRDLMTFDQGYLTMDAHGNQMGRPLGGTFTTCDGRTVDSTGAFLVGELERLDLTLHEPLADVTWGRDIDLREDVTIADEVSSFTLTNFASSGSLGTGHGIGTGKAWIGKTTNQIAGVDIDLAKLPHPLRPWALELKYDILELESAARLGRPIDAQKYEVMKLKHQMDVDEQIYIGDFTMGDTGLVNNKDVINIANLPAGAKGSPHWSLKTPDEILADVNFGLNSVWQASAWAVVPSRILLPPADYGYISTAKVSDAGNVSILKYVLENNLLATAGRGRLEIYPVKWLIGAGVSGTIGTPNTVDRMVVYTKDRKRIRYPMTMLQKTPLQYDSLYHKSTYYCRLGVVEVPYPETVGYFDGL